MRKDYIKEQKQRHGRKALAVLPIQYPKELLTAMDVLAVELWGPPGAPRGPGAGRLQAYVCAVVRNAVAFVQAGGTADVDGFLYPHACDSIQGLATLISDFGGADDKPALHYLNPKGEPRPSSRRFLVAELRDLAGKLAGITGETLVPGRLEWAIGLHREIDGLRLELLEGRARLDLTCREVYEVLRRGEWLWPEDHLTELKEAAGKLAELKEAVVGLDEAGAVKPKGVPLLLTGIVPEPMTIFDELTDMGAYVAADDYAAVGRRVVRRSLVVKDDPVETLAWLMFAYPPCPTRAASLATRLDYLSRLVHRSGAAGVVIHTVKFCEPELFDVTGIKEHFGAQGVPVLFLESELEAELAGQTVTRLEAFVEMVSQQRKS
jgi:benzoyl-CoA reductase/2-hydroxyglutaryl-CoA dehydratase subunit BcrC/BadD/HgdB